MRVMVLTDNEYLYNVFCKIIVRKDFEKYDFDIFFSYNNKNFIRKFANSDFKPIKVKDSVKYIIDNYELVFSLHCKQIFPSDLVNNVRCINVHPGYNPYNRGWFPQVFSIINHLPIGVTIHEMDEEIDYGKIITQKEINIYSDETSYDVYQRLLDLEVELLENWLEILLNNSYKAETPKSVGNYNRKLDFTNLKKIEMSKSVTYKEAIDFLRSMTFPGYNNAYFLDENGNKVYVEIILRKEDN